MVQRRGSQGSALIIALIIVIAVGGMSAAFLSYTFSQSRNTFNASQSESSLNTAEAGIDDAINKLNALAAKTWKGDDLATKAALNPIPGIMGDYLISDQVASGSDFYSVNLATVTGFTRDPVTGLPIPITQTTFTGAVNRGSYDITITPAYYGVGQYTLTAHGTHGAEKKGLSVYIVPGAQNNLGDYGLVGKVTLTATSSNVFVDSFKSSKGTYESQATNTWTDGTTKYAGDQGNLGSNGDITVNNGIVFGSATPGPSSTVTTGKATITGATAPASSPLDIPSFVYKAPDNTPLTWDKGMVDLGVPVKLGDPVVTTTLHYKSVVTSGSGAGISINGPVILYVDGDIGMNATEPLIFNGADASLTIYQGSGSITLNGQTYSGGATPKASNLQISSATTGEIKFNGGADVFANVYAPDATFKQTGTSVFSGKMVASTIDIGGNMTFHRDEDVNGGPTAPPSFKIKVFNETLH